MDGTRHHVATIDRHAGPAPQLDAGTPAPRFVAPTAQEIAIAAALVNSPPVVGAYAAAEWDELSEDGQIWLAVLVREARRPA
jgi:hypothetical protein